ncbi:MAG: alanine racemase [Betaproteobacteria bacterium]|nr:alanine racemase [Betaproteobacteria bacterium]
MSRPLIARIDTAALAHNLGVARRAAPGARVLSVIKANGYGHGLLRAARALRATDGYAVLTLDEAALLRKEGYTHPIVLLEGFFSVDELPEMARLHLRPVLHRADQVELLARTHLEHRLDVLLKVNTGMNRLGLPPARAAEALARLREIPAVAGSTLMTHFASADESAASVAAQLARFAPLAAQAGAPVTLANSAAILRHPATHGDWVRPGILLYGCSPFADADGPDLGLLPAMTLESRLIAVQRVKRGEAVGYGATFVAERDMNVGVVACGYADGYPRHAPNGTPVVVAGHVCRLAGRVSMDMLCVDLAHAPAAHVGSPVELWGASLPVERVAAAAGTIGYELLTALAPRVRVEET